MPRLVRRRRVVRRRRPAVRRPRVRRGMRMRRSKYSGNKDFATVTEVTERLVAGDEGQFITHALNNFARASTVAKNYRFYRCKKVEVEFVPFANIASQGESFPELYFQVDRTGGTVNGAAVPFPTLASMQGRGCLPQKMTSIIKKSYTPSVLRNENFYVSYQKTQQTDGPPPTFSANQWNLRDIQAVSSTPVFNKWYMVQHYPPATATGQNSNQYPAQIGPSIDSMSLQWYGASYFVSQPVASEANIGKLVIRVHWQFKQPLWFPDTGIANQLTTSGGGWEYNIPSTTSTSVSTPTMLLRSYIDNTPT